MRNPSSIRIEEYDYELSPGQIAKFPLPERDQSKLLFLKANQISEKKFSDLPDFLPKGCLLVFNETKVIRARLKFRKETGAQIEIFCLEPVEPISEIQMALQQKPPVIWKCFVGNAKRWKGEKLSYSFEVNNKEYILFAKKTGSSQNSFLVEFTWEPNTILFSEIIENAGLVPLPPYINREVIEDDKTRYQTIYARNDGSVAAPTAGLHFTDKILQKLKQKGIESTKLTLHVGAGTFKPVLTDSIGEHEMHIEKLIVSLHALQKIAKKLDEGIIAVGTTSMRTLESLYWMALKLKMGDTTFQIDQWFPYKHSDLEEFTPKNAIELLIEFLKIEKLEELKGETQLIIAPGYKFQIASGLITNFHQPKSTLLLLVSALIGQQWRQCYEFAKEKNFRFLSYGDSCLFIP